jgi:hypothetical protein
MSLSGRPASVRPRNWYRFGPCFRVFGLTNEAVPDHFRRFPFADLMNSEFVNIVLDVPFRRIESVPVDHGDEL